MKVYILRQSEEATLPNDVKTWTHTGEAVNDEFNLWQSFNVRKLFKKEWIENDDDIRELFVSKNHGLYSS